MIAPNKIKGVSALLELIKKLTEAWGPSGYEHQVRALIKEEVSAYADSIEVDGIGNLICKVGKGGKGSRRVMIAAHMDEIGLMATYAEPNTNYLRFTNIGGLLFTTLHGNRVRFEDGTIGVVAAHDAFGKGRTAAPEITNFFIDVQDETGTMRIPEGSPAGFWREMQVRGNRVVAKSMDDRIGCVVAIEALKRVAKTTPHEVYFAFTVQEEVGLRGAKVAAQGIKPDVGIALDVTATGDEIKNSKMTVKLGGGTAIKIYDLQHIVPPAIKDWMIARAEADNIPHQLEVLTLGSTDAAQIQLAHSGVPSGCISIPCRFVHTTSETVDLSDVQASIDLLSGLLNNKIEL
jgi:tetrahedral aminopeptidase